MDVLMHLAAHPGEVIAGSVLIEAYWPRAVTSPNAIQKIVTELRHALRDGHDGNTYIETVPKRGYRLVAAVTSIDADAVAEQSRAPIIFSIGTRAVVIGPLNSGGSTARGKTFAQRIRNELVTQLNQLINASMSPHAETTDYAVDIDVQGVDSAMHATIAITPVSSDWPSHQEHFDSSVIVHERIAHVVDTLAVLLDVDQRERMRKWGTRNVDAYRDAVAGEVFLRGQSFDSLRQAEEMLRRALDKDPRFATAYFYLAHCYHDLSMTANSTQSRENCRRTLQDLLRSATKWRMDAETILVIEQQYRFVSLVNPFDAEAYFRAEIVNDPSNCDALRRYGNLLVGAKLVNESEQFLTRALALHPEGNRDWFELDWGTVEVARGEFERAAQWQKRNVERFPDATFLMFGLVRNLAKLGRYTEAEFYVSRLDATDAAWAFYARLTLKALRGDLRADGNEIAHAFADPHANNVNRGIISFILGDIEAGVRYWHEIEPGFLPLLWNFNSSNEWFWAPGVVEDERYQALLDDLGFGRRWRAYMRDKVAELTPLTDIEVTTPPPREDVAAL